MWGIEARVGRLMLPCNVPAGPGGVRRRPPSYRSRVTDVDPRRNRVLRGLSPDLFATLIPHLRPVRLEREAVVFGRGRPLAHVFFPVTGATSLMAEGDPGEVAEATIVGPDSLLGAKYVVSPVGPVHAVQQVPGVALRIRQAAFRAFVRDHPPLAELVARHTQAMFLQVAQTAVCNGVHTVEQRAARRLLATADCVDGSSFPLTHEQLAVALGVQRPTVSSVALGFRDSGLIDYRYGTVTVLDRDGLERASCSCYRAVRDLLDRLLPDRVSVTVPTASGGMAG